MKIFWSWQSDTPGKTGGQVIRAALDAAIEEFRQAPDVEEPAEREAREALHVDQDRQGTRGSPELANAILRKIVASAVVTADVTPVSTIPASADGKRPDIRLQSLQILRLLAALAVVVHHLLLHFDTDMHVPALHITADFGGRYLLCDQRLYYFSFDPSYLQSSAFHG